MCVGGACFLYVCVCECFVCVWWWGYGWKACVSEVRGVCVFLLVLVLCVFENTATHKFCVSCCYVSK